MRVLVCGGRDFLQRALLYRYMDALHAHFGFTALIHGAAEGADTLAGEWAKKRAVQVCVFPAQWSRDGKIAGPLRNARMLKEGKPDLVVSFPGGNGTTDMVRMAGLAGVFVVNLCVEALRTYDAEDIADLALHEYKRQRRYTQLHGEQNMNRRLGR